MAFLTKAAGEGNGLDGMIAAEVPGLVAIRRDLHRHPELMFEEHRTSGVVRAELSRLGIGHVWGVGGREAGTGTGVIAHLPAVGVERAGACVGLRADMDALPIEEATGAAYASGVAGVMHACGHDGHTAILLGAARVLSGLKVRPNPVTLIFQPAEEGGGGGAMMCRDGALAGGVRHGPATDGGGGEGGGEGGGVGVDLGPPVTRVHGLHGWPDLELGRVATRGGPMLAATDEFDLVIRGVGGHAAFPHAAVDPVAASAQVIVALQQIVSRNTKPTDAVVVTVASVHGGSANNVIPGSVAMNGTVRTLRDETRAMARARFYEVAQGVAGAMGCRAEITWHDGYPVTENDPAEAMRVLRLAGGMAGAGAVEIPEPFMGGEDFAYYGRHAAASFFLIGLCPAGADPASRPLLHQPTFDFNDEAIGLGVGMMVRLALDGG